MLPTKAIEPRTLSLLIKFMQMPAFQNYALAGGTALALQYEHRKSIDLDLFTNENFDYQQIESVLTKEFGNRLQYEQNPSAFAFFCYIDEVKIDIIKYNYRHIRPLVIYDGIRMFSQEDIAAMKIQAILGRGLKKDFWDLVELSNHYTLKEMIQFHKEKFPSQSLLISIPQALTYFIDANDSEEPISLKGQTWQEIKQQISKLVRQYIHNE
jgi:predicted nucleotidyltransferase component of viral defense system